MKKKALVFALILLAIPILTIAPVFAAGKGTDKKTFKFTFVGQAFTPLTPGFDTGMTRHSHLYWYTGPDGIITLTVDGEQAFEYGANWVGETSDFTYTGEWHGERHKFLDQFDHLEEDFANMHFVYTLDFGGGNVITVRMNGINYRTSPPTSWGNVVGHGTGIFKGIQLQGTAYHDEFGVVTHEGTIMGFTGFP